MTPIIDTQPARLPADRRRRTRCGRTDPPDTAFARSDDPQVPGPVVHLPPHVGAPPASRPRRRDGSRRASEPCASWSRVCEVEVLPHARPSSRPSAACRSAGATASRASSATASTTGGPKIRNNVREQHPPRAWPAGIRRGESTAWPPVRAQHGPLLRRRRRHAPHRRLPLPGTMRSARRRRIHATRRRRAARASCSRRRTTPTRSSPCRVSRPPALRCSRSSSRCSRPSSAVSCAACAPCTGTSTRPVSFGAIKNAIAWLRSGGVVAILVDRDIQKRGIEMEFCGYPAKFPTGAVDLAMRTGACSSPAGSAAPAASRCMPPSARRCRWLSTGNSDEDLRINTARLLALFEQHLGGPGQWSVLDRIWPDELEPAPSADAPRRSRGSRGGTMTHGPALAGRVDR